MREFDSKNGYDGTGAKQQMLAAVQDIKASPFQGKKRLVVKELGANRTHAVIDIDMEHAKDIVRNSPRPPRDREAEGRRDTRSERDQEKDAQRKPKPFDKHKGKYVFTVEERDDSRNPGFQRKKSAEFKAYDCHDKPDDYTPGYETSQKFGRFGGASSTKNVGRIKF